MNKCDLYWLSGILEGEGSFLAGPPSSPNLPSISVEMTDEEIISRISDIFGVKYHKREHNNVRHNDSYAVHLRGKSAIEIMKKIKHIMGRRRQKQIEKAISCYDVKGYRLNEERVKKIKIELSKGYTQGDIAKKFGLRRETINKIYRGKRWGSVTI